MQWKKKRPPKRNYHIMTLDNKVQSKELATACASNFLATTTLCVYHPCVVQKLMPPRHREFTIAATLMVILENNLSNQFEPGGGTVYQLSQ